MINIDFSSVPSREPLPVGIYLAYVSSAEEKISSTGNQMIAIQYKVVAHADETPLDHEQIVFCNYSMVPQALYKFKELCSAIGLDTSGELQLDTSDLVTDQMVQISVTQEEYNGDIQNRVTKVMGI